eukprot:12903904-Prorocentrum_lima.AAC.1
MSPYRLIVYVEETIAHAPVCQEAVQMPCRTASTLLPCNLHAQGPTANTPLACGALGPSVMRQLPMDHPPTCCGRSSPHS